MRCNHLPGDYNGGPSLTEWLAQIWKAVKSIVENGVKNPHKLTFTGDVEAEYDGSKDVTVDISGGGGGVGESDKLWYPYIVEKVLNWRKTTSTTIPAPFDLNQLKGDPGTNGTNGEDGFSPSASVMQTSTGATITITDKTGTTTASVKNGVDGSTGPAGPEGPKGQTGETGPAGAPGAAAGFGTVDATATTGTTAGATVTTDGPDTAKNMHFAFTIPTGGGGGTGDVTAAGNNTFSGTNNFTGRVDFESNVYLGDKTNVSTPTSNENATNKLYVDTLASTTQSTAETHAKNYTDEQIAGAIGVGDTTTLEPGNNATVTETVVGGVHKFSFGIPKGEKGTDGAKGDTGPAGPYTDIEIGTVTTGEPGTNAEASFDTATPGMALLDLKIPRGAPGTNGTNGEDGFSPSASVMQTSTGATITITDKTGTTTASVKNGVDGSTGPAGPEGPKGQTGETGPAGAPGAAAGFGTVDATATTGTTAGATVTTDGPDTAKNMHFAFTIPAGGGGGGGSGGSGGPTIINCTVAKYPASDVFANGFATAYIYDDYIEFIGCIENDSKNVITANWLQLTPTDGTIPTISTRTPGTTGFLLMETFTGYIPINMTTIDGKATVQGSDLSGNLKQMTFYIGKTAYFRAYALIDKT